MASTPSFNWSTPDNTGLVKNGALDIRTLGNAIDTSMTDLLGGTTGQVLKKNSNTDMDFVWSSDSAGMTNPMTTTGPHTVLRIESLVRCILNTQHMIHSRCIFRAIPTNVVIPSQDREPKGSPSSAISRVINPSLIQCH